MPLSETDIDNGGLDFASLGQIVNGAPDLPNPGQPNGTVTTRLGRVIKTVANVLASITASSDTATAAAAAASGSAAAASGSATLAGHYANDNTDVDVPGGAVGSRGAKWWNALAQAAAATANGAVGTVSNLLLTLAGDILSDGGVHPLYMAQNGWPSQNADGTYTSIGSAGNGMTRTYNASGDLAPGKYCSLGVKLKSGAYNATVPNIKFYNGASLLSTSSVGAANALGYRETGAVQIPATVTSIVVGGITNAAGDLIWMAFTASRSAAAAEMSAESSQPVIMPEPAAYYVPLRIASRGQAALVLPELNGTAAAFEYALRLRGITPTSSTLDALALAEEDIYRSGDLQDILYLNFYCGAADFNAFRMPFITKAPYTQDPVSYTTAPVVTEAGGLPTGINMPTGIVPALHSMSRYGLLYGVYGLADQATDISFSVIGDGSNMGLYPKFAGLTINDRMNGGGSGRVQATFASSKGLLLAGSDETGRGFISLNAQEIGSDPRAGAAPSKTMLRVNTTYLSIGASIIMRNAKASTPGWLFPMIHEVQKALGRAVTGEGIY